MIFFQPQAFLDAWYAPKLFLAGALPRTPLGSLRRTPESLVGWGGDAPATLRPLELGAFGTSLLNPPRL